MSANEIVLSACCGVLLVTTHGYRLMWLKAKDEAREGWRALQRAVSAHEYESRQAKR